MFGADTSKWPDTTVDGAYGAYMALEEKDEL